jgi:hypothetical protein
MQNPNPFQNLRFVQPRPLPTRLIFVGATTLLCAGLWWLIPPSVLFWLMLVGVAVFAWVASYGWRDAIHALLALLRRLEQL